MRRPRVRQAVLATAVLAGLLPAAGCGPRGGEVVRQFPPTPVWPEDHRYTLDELIELAIHCNPSLDAARYSADAAEGFVDQIKALWLPMLRYNFMAAGYTNDAVYRLGVAGIPVANVPITGRYNLNHTATVTQILFSGGKRLSVLRQARDFAAIQRLQVLVQQDAVAFDVADAYLRVCLWNDVDAALGAALARVRAVRSLLASLHAQGSRRANRLDLAEIDALAARLEGMRVAARASRHQAYQQMRTHIGVRPDQILLLRQVSLPAVVTAGELAGGAATLMRGFLARPEVRQADLLAALFHEQARFVKGAWWPNVVVGAAFSDTHAPQRAVFDVFGGLLGGLLIDVPIYDPGQRGRLRQVLGLEHATMAVQQQVESVIALEIETTRVEAQKAFAMAWRAGQAWQAAGEYGRSAREAFAHDASTAARLIEALEIEAQAELDRLHVMYAYHNARARLKRVTGDREVGYDF